MAPGTNVLKPPKSPRDFGPRYTFQCTICGMTFKRSCFDSRLERPEIDEAKRVQNHTPAEADY